MISAAPDLPAIDGRVDAADAAVAFARDGHAVVRDLATVEEIDAYRPHIAAAVRQRNPDPPPLEVRDTYGKAFVQSMNLWRISDAVRRFVCSPRFASVAACLLGVEGVRLYHDQALFKEPGGGPTPWHQDQVYWPLDTDRTITMWMPLVDVGEAVGSMTFASGSHRHDVASLDISDASEQTVDSALALGRWPTSTHGALRAGDATFHAGRTLHRAGPNPTDGVREVMTIIWFADGARATTPTNPYQELDLRLWLRGTEPGQVAAGPLNPRLWPT